MKGLWRGDCRYSRWIFLAAPLCAFVVSAVAAPAPTAEEAAVLDAVVDGDDRLVGPGLEILFRHADDAGEDQALREAEVVPMADLRAEPAEFRGRRVHLNMHIWRITRWDRPDSAALWRLDGTDRETKIPLILFLARRPEGLTEGEQEVPATVSTTALLYKVARLPVDRPAAGAPETGLYPVFAAGRLYGVAQPRRRVGRVILVGLLVAAALAYLLARRAAARRRSGAAGPSMESDKPATGDEPGRSVDEDLVREVRRFKARSTREEER